MKKIKFKDELLEDYSKREPNLLIKYEGHGYENVSVEEQHKVLSSVTPELLNAVDVVIFINPYNAKKKEALFLISAIMDCIKNDNKVFKEAKIEYKEYVGLCRDNEILMNCTNDLLEKFGSLEQLECIFNRVQEAITTEKSNHDRECVEWDPFNGHESYDHL